MATLPPVTLVEALGVEGEVTVFKPKGEPNYHVYFRVGQRQINRSCGTAEYAAAKLKAAQIFAAVVSEPTKQEDTRNLKTVVDELKDLVQHLTQQLTHSRAGNPSSIAIGIHRKKDLEVACEAFLDVKREKTSRLHVEGLSHRVRRFVRFAKEHGINFVHEVTDDICQQWLDSLQVAGRTFNGYRGDLGTFLIWCSKAPRKWTSVNPIKDISKEKVTLESPKVLTPAQIEEFLRYVEAEMPQYACFYAISIFAGVRADKREGELARLARSVAKDGWNPYLTQEVLRIPSPKVGFPRDFPLTDNLRAWLAAYPNLEVPTQWYHQRLVQRFNIPYNAFRHSAISAFVRKCGSMVDAAVHFGNSEAMIKRHYLRLFTPEQAAAFYAIMPQSNAAAERGCNGQAA